MFLFSYLHKHEIIESFIFQDDPDIPEFSTGMLLVPQIGAFIQILEILIYAIIYKEILDHDKYMFRSSVISKERYIKRKQKNSFTLTVQVLFFVCEGLFNFSIVLMNAVSTNLSMKELIVIYRVQQFTFLTLLKVACSQEIRQTFIPKFIRHLLRFFKWNI